MLLRTMSARSLLSRRPFEETDPEASPQYGSVGSGYVAAVILALVLGPVPLRIFRNGKKRKAPKAAEEAASNEGILK